MSAIWFDTGSDAMPEIAWELYHENSKRGRRFRISGGGHDHGAADDMWPDAARQIFPLEAAPSTLAVFGAGTAEPARSEQGTMPLASLAAILAAACAPAGDRDPTEFLLHIEGVGKLPVGLYRYDRRSPSLCLLRRDAERRTLMAAMPEAGLDDKPQAMLFIVGDLAGAARAEGERGYRTALMAAGRHMLAVRLAAAAAGAWSREIADFYDREVDALLSLDGLSRSVLGVILLGAADDG